MDKCYKFLAKTFGNLVVFCYSDGTIIMHDFYKRRTIEFSPHTSRRFINFISRCMQLFEECNKTNNQPRRS